MSDAARNAVLEIEALVAEWTKGWGDESRPPWEKIEEIIQRAIDSETAVSCAGCGIVMPRPEVECGRCLCGEG